jgi:AraC family transcriptional regulator of arabinose operon
MADIKRVALTQFRMISGEPIDQQDIREAGEYFANSESPIDLKTFRTWFLQVQANLDNQVDLLRLAREWQLRLAGRHAFTEAEAQFFHKQYIAALDMAGLMTQAIVAGFATRTAGSAYDYEISQPRQSAAWTILYTVAGQAILRTGLRETRVNPGDILLLAPKSVYSIVRSEDSDSWNQYWITFKPLTRWRTYLDWPKAGPEIGLLQIDPERRPLIESVISSLLSNYAQQSNLKEELDFNLLEQLLLRCANMISDTLHLDFDERIKKAQQFIDEHYNHRFSLHDVATCAHISASRLSSLFKQQTGVTIFGWRDEKRMLEAAQLLRGTDISIAEIGQLVGISDPAYFSRVFQRHVGTSPRAYRQGLLNSL